MRIFLTTQEHVIRSCLMWAAIACLVVGYFGSLWSKRRAAGPRAARRSFRADLREVFSKKVFAWGNLFLIILAFLVGLIVVTGPRETRGDLGIAVGGFITAAIIFARDLRALDSRAVLYRDPSFLLGVAAMCVGLCALIFFLCNKGAYGALEVADIALSFIIFVILLLRKPWRRDKVKNGWDRLYQLGLVILCLLIAFVVYSTINHG